MKTKRDQTSKLRAVAFHEAGHAVVAHFEEGRDGFLTIEPNDDSLGYVDGESPDSYVHPTPKQIEASVVTLFAGYASQVRLQPAKRAQARAGASDDFRKATGLLRTLKHSPARRRKLMQRAQALTREHWKCIEALALFVLWIKQVTGAGSLPPQIVELIIETARGDEHAKFSLIRSIAMQWSDLVGRQVPTELQFLFA